jgi:hypothetical protein
VHLLPSWNTYSTRKTRSPIERNIVSKKWIKQLHTLPALYFNRCLTADYSETTAHFNGIFNTGNQIYVTYPKCTANFRKYCMFTITPIGTKPFKITRHPVDKWLCALYT